MERDTVHSKGSLSSENDSQAVNKCLLSSYYALGIVKVVEVLQKIKLGIPAFKALYFWLQEDNKWVAKEIR